jgi:hypothetical protein
MEGREVYKKNDPKSGGFRNEGRSPLYALFELQLFNVNCSIDENEKSRGSEVLESEATASLM